MVFLLDLVVSQASSRRKYKVVSLTGWHVQKEEERRQIILLYSPRSRTEISYQRVIPWMNKYLLQNLLVGFWNKPWKLLGHSSCFQRFFLQLSIVLCFSRTFFSVLGRWVSRFNIANVVIAKSIFLWKYILSGYGYACGFICEYVLVWSIHALSKNY